MRKAKREEIQKLLDNSFVVRTAEGAGETGKFPADNGTVFFTRDKKRSVAS